MSRDKTGQAVELYNKMLKHETLSAYYDDKLKILINTGDVDMEHYYSVTEDKEAVLNKLRWEPTFGELHEDTVRGYVNEILKG